MKVLSLLLIIILFPFFLFSQENLSASFSAAYQAYPGVPKGVLEAVSWVNTRMHNANESYQKGCTGLPLTYGVMGVLEDGADWFVENGKLIAELSGISVEEQKANVGAQVMAYAAAFETIYNGIDVEIQSRDSRIYYTLAALSQFNNEDNVDRYTIDSYIYDVFMSLSKESFAQEYSFERLDIDFVEVFGEENYQVLSSPHVLIKSTGIESKSGIKYLPKSSLIFDKVETIWDPAASCNYKTGRSSTISAITIHTVQGSYAGCISWFKNCDASVSAHYVLRSSDGQITQMVAEANTAWHVGSENSYTIGFEHEGKVEEDGWYTEAMYNASAELVKDICSRRGIDRKRVSYYPWASTTYYNQSGIPGPCNKIKGHMHYPNQTHNDPGPRWNWEHFDNLINDNVPTTTITATSGTIYDTGGASGNYSDDERSRWLIAPTGAETVTLNFTSFETENTWDYLYIYNGSSTNAPLIGKYTGTTGPGTVVGTSGKLYLLFKSECGTNHAGWSADISSTSPEPIDATPPTTEIAAPNDWVTEDFDVEFTDADEEDGSGVQKSFYQVLEYNGYTWGANEAHGFYGDNFDSTHLKSLWTSVDGNWSVVNNFLHQSDEGQGNTNLYTPLTQNLSNQYLYVWSAKIGGSGTNRRAGIHIFSDSPTSANRGNSYLVYFRPDASLPANQPNKEIQLYRVENDELTLVKQEDYNLNADQEYEYAIRYDRISGKFVIYINNEVVLSWVDPNPIAEGTHFSFRSGDCTYDVRAIKVYRSRYPNVTISVGPGSTNDIRIQNSDPDTPAGRVKSIIVDNAENLSEIAFEDINVDWTAPQDLIVNDGPGVDIDTINAPMIQANWGTVNDPHSGIMGYEMAIGTSPNADDVYAWSGANLGLNPAVSYALTNPVYGQIYYVSIRAINGAGLVAEASSDGQRLVDESNLGMKEGLLEGVKMYPNPATKTIFFDGMGENTSVSLYDAEGKLVLTKKFDQGDYSIDVEQLCNGSYNVVLENQNQFLIKKLIKR